MTFRLSILGAAVGATASTLLLVGCSSGGSYYMVREPGSGTPYYTTAYERAGNYAVQFRDGRTGSAVVLQNSEVTQISKDDYTRGITTPVPAPAAATVAPVPTVTVAPVGASAGASAPPASVPLQGAPQ